MILLVVDKVCRGYESHINDAKIGLIWDPKNSNLLFLNVFGI